MEDKDKLHIDGNASDELVLKHGDSVHVRLGNDSDYICLFKPDGSIEINPKYTVDERLANSGNSFRSTHKPCQN